MCLQAEIIPLADFLSLQTHKNIYGQPLQQGKQMFDGQIN